jgi:hypothetical protein
MNGILKKSDHISNSFFTLLKIIQDVINFNDRQIPV